MLQFQHGKYSVESNGSLVLTPFAVDGRQMITSPCKDKDAAYFRFNRTEIFQVCLRLLQPRGHLYRTFSNCLETLAIRGAD